MTTTNDSSSGTNDQAASGAEDKKKDTVQYDTHLKLLDEKKRVQAEKLRLEEELKVLKQEKETRERAELEQQGNFKKLLEQERERANKLEETHKGLLDSLHEARKRSAVLKFVNGRVPDEVVGPLLSVDGVALNEDGTVNEDTAKIVAQDFEKRYHYVIMRDGNVGNIPNGAAHGGTNKKLTYQEWLALKDSKEMKKRSGEVDWSTA